MLSTDEEETVEDQAENHTETQKEDGEIVEKTNGSHDNGEEANSVTDDQETEVS